MEYNVKMEWKVLLDEDFVPWLEKQEVGLQDEILAYANVLEIYGPQLGRPRVDTLAGTSVNLKELRVQYKGDPWRILFAFDTQRRAILLVGGNKRGSKRWYKVHIPIAEERLRRHLKNMEKKNG